MNIVTWPRFKLLNSSWRAADRTSNVRHKVTHKQVIVQAAYNFWNVIILSSVNNQDKNMLNEMDIQLIRPMLSSDVTGDRELIQEVLFDAVVTAPLEAYWTGLALNKSE